jgi:hypothetical protein
MLSLGSSKVRLCDGVTRRDFLRAGGLSVLGLSMADQLALSRAQAAPAGPKNCILLFLCGGPSQLDTWDLKPDAPAEIRGPFQPIRTNVPGIEISEHFPRMAAMADKYTLVRSVYHKESPIHEAGHQMMQTGWLFRGGIEHPHYGAVLSKLRGSRGGLPPYVVLPEPIGNTGVNVPHGQHAGYLGPEHDPVYLHADPASADFRAPQFDVRLKADPARLASPRGLVHAVDSAQRAYETSARASNRTSAEQEAYRRLFSRESKWAFDINQEPGHVRARYGRNTFGQSCLLARRLVEHGVSLVTVNMFDTVFNKTTWDCHANGGDLSSTLDDYRTTLCPIFDTAYTALLTDLSEHGLLASTLVVAMGEFGRTYKLNSRGGRDHWPGVWTIVMAGGGVPGGKVVGASDARGAEPSARPVHPSELAASIYRALDIDPKAQLGGPEDRSMPLVQAEPVDELFLA